MLELINVRVEEPRSVAAARPGPTGPLVIVANHPFGIGDGVAVLSLAEQLGRPFRVMINSEAPEGARRWSLTRCRSISARPRKRLKNNLAVRHEAVRLLKEGVTIVIFPGGRRCNRPERLRPREDLPWKIFPARLIQEAKATVIPMYFSGQNGRLFHIVSGPMGLLERENRIARFVGGVSLTLRTSLLIHEFARLSGKSLFVRIGEAIPPEAMAHMRDRKALAAVPL